MQAHLFLYNVLCPLITLLYLEIIFIDMTLHFTHFDTENALE